MASLMLSESIVSHEHPVELALHWWEKGKHQIDTNWLIMLMGVLKPAWGQVLACNPHTGAFFTPAMAESIVEDTAGQSRAQIVGHVMEAAGVRYQVQSAHCNLQSLRVWHACHCRSHQQASGNIALCNQTHCTINNLMMTCMHCLGLCPADVMILLYFPIKDQKSKCCGCCSEHLTTALTIAIGLPCAEQQKQSKP